ncbi:MAG TPA: MBL fold metallo-hydrolase [Candidatus Dormibacteraeota bacterium]|nr:MBL fold metallo-hydrolase [Candidatus Dormibacteraeota bacterium]
MGAERLSERVFRLRAPNPGPMTFTGTNSYLVDGGRDRFIAIDPGPAHEAHALALALAAADLGGTIAAILVTHGHPDHAPGAARLAALTGAQVYGHPRALFPHTATLWHEKSVDLDEVTLQVLDAPGHAVDHVALYLPEERAIFTGDVVVGEGTVVVAPPGGEMATYRRTLESLRERYPDAARIYGGHGPEVRDPPAKLAEYVAHRARREHQVLEALAAGDRTIPEMVARIYADLDRVLWPAAARQVLAYLDALEVEGRARRLRQRSASTAERALLEIDLSRLEDPVALAELGARDDRSGVIVEYEPG